MGNVVVIVQVKHVAGDGGQRCRGLVGFHLGAQNPGVLLDILRHAKGLILEDFVEAVIGENPLNRGVQRLARGAGEGFIEVRPANIGQPEAGQGVCLCRMDDAVVNPLSDRHLREDALHLINQRAVQLHCLHRLADQRVQVKQKVSPQRLVFIARVLQLPVGTKESPHFIGVHRALQTEHQIDFQRVIQQFRTVDVALHRLFKTQQQTRQKDRVQGRAVALPGLVGQPTALIEPPGQLVFRRERARHCSVNRRRDRVHWHGAQDVQRGHGDRGVTVGNRVAGHLGGGGLIIGDRLFDPRHQVQIAGIAAAPQQAHDDGDYCRQRHCAAFHPAIAAFDLIVGGNQTGLREQNLGEQACQEKAATGATPGAQSLPANAKGPRHGQHQTINRGAFLGTAGEIDPAQHLAVIIAVFGEYLGQERLRHAAH